MDIRDEEIKKSWTSDIFKDDIMLLVVLMRLMIDQDEDLEKCMLINDVENPLLK